MQSDDAGPSVRPQPMLAVRDVEAARAWYQRVLGLTGGHGGNHYEQLLSGGTLILQLHQATIGHHHGPIGDPGAPFGNGVAIWFEVDDFDNVVERARAAGASIERDVQLNPNSGNRELWLRDPDGYLVVAASTPVEARATGADPASTEAVIARRTATRSGAIDMAKAAQVTLWNALTFRDAKKMVGWLEAIGFVTHIAHWDEAGEVLHHAEMLWGTGGIMFGSYREGRTVWPQRPGSGACYLVAADPDAVYAAAIGAGATSVQEPADEGYGRGAAVADPEGNLWSIGVYQPS